MKFRYRATALAMAGMLAALNAAPAFAATTYNQIAGTSCNFNKYLIMDEGDTVPNATFSFTVAPGTAIPAVVGSANPHDDHMEVMAGVGAPNIADVTFAPGDTTKLASDVTATEIDVQRTNVQRGGSAGDTVQLDTGEKYATKTATVDFSSVTFKEPGIYRYVVTETANATHASAGIIHDTDTDRILDVYVTDDGTGQLAVAAYVLHTDANNVPFSVDNGSGSTTPLADKTDGFTNEYASKDLKVEKAVTGNQASRDKYFEFTVTATNVADADSYVVSLANDDNAATNDGNADATSGAEKTGGTIAANAGKTNPTTVTGAQLKAGQKFYLQHGQYVVIRGLAPDAGYTVTENAEDYKSEVLTGKTNSGTIGTVAGSEKMAQAGFLNTRDGVIPTGVILTVLPFALLFGAGAAGFVFMSTKKKRG